MHSQLHLVEETQWKKLLKLDKPCIKLHMVPSGSDKSRNSFSCHIVAGSFRFTCNHLFRIFLDPAVSKWSVKTIWQVWSCPVYGDQLGFMHLSFLMWIISEIQNTYTHTYAWCLLEYLPFIFDALILLTHTGWEGEKEKEMENSWFPLFWCMCFFLMSLKYSTNTDVKKYVTFV